MLKKRSEFDNGGGQRESKEVEALPVRLDRLKVYITEVEKHAMFSPDVVQEGNVGLLHAVKKTNPYKGTKFSTFAQFWIRGQGFVFLGSARGRYNRGFSRRLKQN